MHFQTTKPTKSLKKLVTPVISGMAALVSQVAHAGPALPWDGPITTVVNNLTGPVATGISTVAFLAAGAALIFGGDDLGGIAGMACRGDSGDVDLLHSASCLEWNG